MITKIKQILSKGKTILYPTDTVWGIGCDATNFEAVNKIYQIKNRAETKSLIVLVASFEMLQDYIDFVPEKVKTYLEKQNFPTTVIYKNPKNLAKNVIAKDNTIAIRIVTSGLSHKIITAFKKPIVSTSANVSGEETPLNFDSIKIAIKNNVDFIVNHKDDKKEVKSSKIIRFVGNKIEILRD